MSESKSQHTPGPWEYSRQGEPSNDFMISAGILGIAHTVGDSPTDEANARLIAAALDMLEQFKYILKIATDAIPEEYSGLIKAACNKIIAKAEGKE